MFYCVYSLSTHSSNKVNGALNLDHTKSQWVDLGLHTDVCMTRPETCGAAGGAISLWVNVTYCPQYGQHALINQQDR